MKSKTKELALKNKLFFLFLLIYCQLSQADPKRKIANYNYEENLKLFQSTLSCYNSKLNDYSSNQKKTFETFETCLKNKFNPEIGNFLFTKYLTWIFKYGSYSFNPRKCNTDEIFKFELFDTYRDEAICFTAIFKDSNIQGYFFFNQNKVIRISSKEILNTNLIKKKLQTNK